MPQQLYIWSRCGGGYKGIKRVRACSALTGTINLNMKGFDISQGPMFLGKKKKECGGKQGQLFPRPHLPALSHYPVIWTNML